MIEDYFNRIYGINSLICYKYISSFCEKTGWVVDKVELEQYIQKIKKIKTMEKKATILFVSNFFICFHTISFFYVDFKEIFSYNYHLFNENYFFNLKILIFINKVQQKNNTINRNILKIMKKKTNLLFNDV